MSIKVEFSDGVFKPLEKVDNLPLGAVYTVLSEEELRGLTEDLQWLKSSEKSFEFWDNPGRCHLRHAINAATSSSFRSLSLTSVPRKEDVPRTIRF